MLSILWLVEAAGVLAAAAVLVVLELALGLL
jgi:hypothetical protein